MENNYFLKLFRFLKKHLILSILLVVIFLYLIISDSKEIANRKKTCLSVLNIPKETRILIFPAQQNKDYVKCYKDLTYFVAYQIPNKIDRIKKEISEFNEFQKKMNSEILIKDKNQYRQVKINEFLNDNFQDSFSLKPKNIEVLDKKIYFS